MKQMFFTLVMLLLYACNNSKDELQKSEFGIINYDKFEEQMINEGLLLEPTADSTYYTYFISDNGKKYKTEVSFNSNGYKFGKLRDIEINLNSDSIYMNGSLIPLRSAGPRLKKDVDQIFMLYNKWYGKPDSLYTKYPLVKYEGDDPFSLDAVKLMFSNKVDSSKTPERTAVWERANFSLSFHLPFPEIEPNLDSSLVYRNASISYKMIRYDEELSRIKDSIRKTFTPKDLITMEVYQPIWSTLNTNTYSGYDSKIEVNVREIRRKDLEEPKGVTGVRFDIVITDKFNKELCRMKDATYEPSQPLMNGSSGLLAYNTATTTFATDYFKNSKSSDSLERARIYSKTNKVKVYTEIKAIAFTDGSVLESTK